MNSRKQCPPQVLEWCGAIGWRPLRHGHGQFFVLLIVLGSINGGPGFQTPWFWEKKHSDFEWRSSCYLSWSIIDFQKGSLHKCILLHFVFSIIPQQGANWAKKPFMAWRCQALLRCLFMNASRLSEASWHVNFPCHQRKLASQCKQKTADFSDNRDKAVSHTGNRYHCPALTCLNRYPVGTDTNLTIV